MYRIHLNHVTSQRNSGICQIKVLIKFEALEMMCVELTGEKATKSVPLLLPNMWNLISYSHVQSTPKPCCQSTKLRNITISIKTKVLIKFEAWEIMCVELRGKKLRKVYHLPNMWNIISYSHVRTSRIHLKHVASQCNSGIRLLASK